MPRTAANLDNTDNPQQSVSEDFGTDPAGEYAIALNQRGDLRAIELLANDPASVTTEQLALLATGGTPLLNAKLPVPKVAQWWQFRIRSKIKQQLEVISQQETIRRREQLNWIWRRPNGNRSGRKSLMRPTHSTTTGNYSTIKQRRLASLRQSILAAERAKDEVQLDAEKHVEKSA